jgi:hypothetical protein
MQRHIALFKAFPTYAESVDAAKKCIALSVSEFEAKGHMVVYGVHFLVLHVLFSKSLVGLDLAKDMEISASIIPLDVSLNDFIMRQVFQEAGNYRNTLKILGRDVVRSKYADVLNPEEFEEGNQLELEAIIMTGVKNMLKDGSFLQNGHDKNANIMLAPFMIELMPTRFLGPNSKPGTP